MLSTEHLSITINGSRILFEVSTQCAAGELLAVIGPNGAGKSTFIRALAGTLQPTSGRLQYNQRDLSTYTPRERARLVSYLPQTMQYEPGYTVEAFIRLANFPWQGEEGGTPTTQRLEEAISICRIEGLRNRAIQTLSSGERQRVYLAQVVFQNTPVLLLDEPTTFLDLKHVIQIETVLRTLKQAGKIVICITHDLHAARHISTQVLALQNGSVFAQGPPQDILQAQTIARLFEVDQAVLPERFHWSNGVS